MDVRDIHFVKSATTLEQMPDEGFPEVAFIGRSNVGKSSLLNMLCRRKSLARISGTPGKTQTFNFYQINRDVYFVDVPGYGYAKVSKQDRNRWRGTIVSYLTERVTLRIVLHLIDSRHAPTELDREVMLLLSATHAQCMLILTKADKLSGNGINRSIQTVRRSLGDFGVDMPILVTSASQKRGRQELLHRIGSSIFTA